MGLVESRPVVQAMFLSRFLIGAVLTGRAGDHLAAVALGAAGWLAGSVAVYAFNGLMDVTEDRENRSARPIATGRLSLVSAAIFTCSAAVLALGLSIAAGIGIDIASFLGLGYVYSGPPRPAKRSGVTASAVVGLLGIVTFCAGAHSAQGDSRAAVVFGLVISCWMGLVGALAKDIGDVPGDALAGRRTFAVRCGIAPVARCTAVTAVLIAVAGITASALTAPVLFPSCWCWPGGSVRVAGSCRALPAQPARVIARNPYRSFMVTQYAVTATLIVTLLAEMR